MRHKEYGRRFPWSVESNLVNRFASPFTQKVKIFLTPHRNSKYDTGQEYQTGPPELHDVRE